MPRGTPLTPGQMRTASRVYAETGNYSEAARAIGVTETTVRRRLQKSKRADLHARAIERGMREARRALRTMLGDAARRASVAVDGRDYAAVVGAVSKTVDSLVTLREASVGLTLKRLSRDRLKAEIALLEARRLSLLDWDEVLSRATPEQREQLRSLAESIKAQSAGGAEPPALPRPGEPEPR